jgi:hypothetical protein
MIHAERIRQIVDRELVRLRGITAAEAAAAHAPGKWSRKEVLGHLIDSAGNNLQRLVRAQEVDRLEFPGYAQNDWVRCQGYAARNWGELIDLWAALNRHVAHAVELVPEGKNAAIVVIGGGAPMTLEAMVIDYLRHVEHHLEQI